MALHTPPEVKIAFIGNRQSGKTSLVNALLQGNGSRIANGVSSVGINSFRVVGLPRPPEMKTSEETLKPSPFVFGGNKAPEASPSLPMPSAIRNEFIALPNFRTMHMTTTDVRLQESMFDMYPYTSFVLTDVPGINAEDPEDIYLQYLNARWESFDCVVVVLNAQEDVLLQLDILHRAKENQVSQRETSILFVCNKVDDRMNQTVMKSLESLRKLVKSIFNAPIIPLSAGNAFAVRQAQGLTLQRFQELYTQDRALYEKIAAMVLAVNHQPGRQQVSHQPNAAMMQSIVTSLESEVFRSGILAASNFPGFLIALGESIGECMEQKIPDKAKQ